MAGSCEHDTEPSGPIKGLDFLHQQSNSQLLKKNSYLVGLVRHR
jgi:hypothetical protein